MRTATLAMTACLILALSACTTTGAAKKADDAPREHLHHIGRFNDL